MTLEKSTKWATLFLGLFALFAAMRVAGDMLAPLALALVLGIVLSPLTNLLEGIGMSKVLAALFMMLFSLVFLAGLLLFFGPYISRLLVEAPEIWRELRTSFVEVQRLLQGVLDASEEVAKAISPDGNGQAEEEAPVIPTITDAIFAAPAFAAQLMVFLGTLFFFALTRTEVYCWLAKVFEGSDYIIAHRLEEADRLVSRYFLTIALINVCFGCLVTAALWVIGLPSPILWGVVAALMNFILYLGPAVLAVALLVAGIVVFDGFQVALPALAFVSINLIEGQFVTPLLVGRHIQVNPLLVFLSLVFWLWLWGPVGGIVAIPLLIWCLAIAGQLGELPSYPALTPAQRLGARELSG